MGRRAKSVVFLIVVFAAWEAAVELFSVPKFLLPSPSSILTRMAQSPQLLAHHSMVTIGGTLEGFVLALVIGIALAVLIVHSRLVEETFYPILIFLQITPKMAIAPLLIVWMGFGDLPKITIAFLISFFPIVIDTATGLRSIEHEQLEMLRGLRATRWQILRKARFPSAMPFVFSAMRISITLAITGAVVAEFVGASEGLGYLIVISSSAVQTDLTFAAILTLALIGVVLFWLVGVVERLLAPWQDFTHQHTVAG